MRIKPLPLSFRSLLVVLLRADGDAGKGHTMGAQWAAERGVVRKENISVGNSFLSVWGHKQMEAQEERKETKTRKEDRKMCKHMRGKVGAPMLGSKEMEVAGGHRCNTGSCTGSQSGFFSVPPEDISQTDVSHRQR